ncbi:MAG: N-acetylneuraminate synthase [Promethearchaeota archaeon]
MIIKQRIIDETSPIFLIAEAGVNHNGQLEIAKKMIDVAKEANVDAIKFQTFITEKLLLKTTPKAQYQIRTKNDNENFYDMIKKYEFSKNEFLELKNYCDKKKIIFLSTPFDLMSVQWLEELNVPAYKIGSGDMDNFPLLRVICEKKKPILLSTGMATLEEVKETVKFLEDNNITDLVIFQCTTNYPASYEEINLNVIDTFKKEFPNYLIGFSDHSLGIEASIGAAAKGVKVIEKHFTLDKSMKGPDHDASLDPHELKQWVKSIRLIEKTLGSFDKFPSEKEKEISKVARKSIVTIKDLKKNEILAIDNISIKRPGIGISPKFFEKVVGKKVNKDIPKDSVLKWGDLY